MSELIGRTLGQYQIIEQIGKGGMATVYRAYQPSLNRYVALKVLSPIHAREEPDFNERFRREAESIANLRHPNILPVYDFGHEQDYSYIAMAYVEGARTLREVMAEPLSLSQVADLIGQIAAALDCAHQQKVIHRDVKPSNVLMDGNWALLTDFGLAKMTEASVKLTGSGVGVGTPAYMSPEQGQGAEIDRRTDVYSLGVILFEMLTGQIPHDAETPFAIVLKRVTEPLPLPRAINPDIPEAVERVILKALAREPDDRFASAGAMAEALKQAISEPASEEEPAVIQPEIPTTDLSQAKETLIFTRRALPWQWVIGIGAGIVAAALLVWGLSAGFVRIGHPPATPTAADVAALVPTATPTAPTPTDIPLPAPTSTPRPTPTDTLKPPTPTGTNTATPTSTSTPKPTPMATSTSTSTPHPPTATPTPTETPELPTLTPFGGGIRLAFDSNRGGNYEIYVLSTNAVNITRLTFHSANDSRSDWSSDGQRIAFHSNRDGNYEIYVMNADGTDQKRLTTDPGDDAYPVWSPDGRYIAFHSYRDGDWNVYVMGAGGTNQVRLTTHLAFELYPDWSPGGKRIIFQSNRDGNDEIYVMNPDGTNKARLSANLSDDRAPVWSPDGRHIAFHSIRDGNWEIYRMNADGTNKVRLTSHSADDLFAAWCFDGRYIAFHSYRDGNWEIYAMDADGANQFRLTDNSADDWNAAWLP